MVAGDHMVTQAVRGKGKPRWLVSALARKACWHVRFEVRKHKRQRGMWEREERKHVNTQSMVAREHVSTQGSLACEHVFSMEGTQIRTFCE